MAFGHWQIGLHIQQDSIFSVALTPGRAGWALRRWWHIPLPLGTVENGQLKAPQQLLTTLLPWRKSLPQRHRVRLAFPAARTLQRKLPRPAMALRENELASWVSHAMARELEMAAADLRFDYTEDSLAQAYSVTAAQHKDVAEMLELATSLHLNLTSLTPDACALQHLVPFLPPPARCLIWEGDAQWLWATRTGWGRRSHEDQPTVSELSASLGLDIADIALCTAATPDFDPWSALVQRQPPLPPNGMRFAVAIGLALGAVR